MSRPAHIAALDGALEESLSELRSAEVEVHRVLDKYIVELDRIETELNAVLTVRAAAYSDIRNCASSIETLGFVLTQDQRRRLKAVESYSITQDKKDARERAAQRVFDDHWRPELGD